MCDSRRDAYDRMDDALTERLMEVVERLVAKGVPQDEAGRQAIQIIFDAMEGSAPDLADSLITEGRLYVTEVRAYEAGFQERLRAEWGEALDLYLVFVVAVEYYGQRAVERAIEANSGEMSPRLDVLMQMHGQALRVAREVHTLLSAGYHLGALALSRTLYEIAVRATVIEAYGRDDPELATRYLEHARVGNAEDAEVYQRDAGALGYDPFDDHFMEGVRAEREELLQRYGTRYRAPYGWALGLPGVGSGRDFQELEALAQTQHRRGLYRWASHLVHADAKGLRLGQVERGGRRAVLIGATNIGLADPADHALYALNLVFISLILGCDGASLAGQHVVQALRVILLRMQDELTAAERRVHEAEERLQAELAERGMRLDPALGEVPLDEADTD